MSSVNSLDESQEGSGAIAASALMLGAMTLGIIEVARRNTSLTNTRALLEIAAVLALSFALGFAARFCARAWSRWKRARSAEE